MGLPSCPSWIGYYLSQHTIKWACIVKFHHPIEVIYTSQAWAEEPHGESPVIRWQGNRRCGPGLQMVLHAMHGPPVCEELQHYGPLLGHSWSTVKRENFPVHRTLGSALHCAHCLQGEMARSVITYQFMGCGQWFRNMWGTWCENWWQRNMGKRNVDGLLWSKNMKVFVSHMNAHQRVTSAGDSNNQVDRMTHSVDTSQPVSLATYHHPMGSLTK